MKISTLIYTSIAAVAFSATSIFANEPVVRSDSTTLWFENWGTLSNATLKVISPDGTVSTFMSERGTPRVSLRDLKSVEDGVYKYDLSAATDEVIKVDTELNNGRGKAQRDTMFKPFSMGGIFFVTRGAISQKELLLEE